MWDLVPQPGIEARPPVSGAGWSLSHWTTKEVPSLCLFNSLQEARSCCIGPEATDSCLPLQVYLPLFFTLNLSEKEKSSPLYVEQKWLHRLPTPDKATLGHDGSRSLCSYVLTTKVTKQPPSWLIWVTAASSSVTVVAFLPCFLDNIKIPNYMYSIRLHTNEFHFKSMFNLQVPSVSPTKLA